jgi:NEDD8-activating enzyme E1
MGSLPPQTTFPICTIKETPRLPEHCIAYAFVIEWPQHFPDRKLDGDSPADMQWVCERATERAKVFGIEGVTYRLTMGFVKNIIPAVASTNALVAAACVNETFKILTGCNYKLNNYMQYSGQTNVSVTTFEYQREPDCLVCSRKELLQEVIGSEYLKDFVERIKEQLKLQAPLVKGMKGFLVGRGIFAAEAEGKLEMTFS